MMTMTASTACSSRRPNAPMTAASVGMATGISVMPYPRAVASAAMPSRVLLLPTLASENRITPIVRKLPHLRARAALLGR